MARLGSGDRERHWCCCPSPSPAEEGQPSARSRQGWRCFARRRWPKTASPTFYSSLRGRPGWADSPGNHTGSGRAYSKGRSSEDHERKQAPACRRRGLVGAAPPPCAAARMNGGRREVKERCGRVSEWDQAFAVVAVTFQEVPSRIIAQQRISNRLATATMAILRRDRWREPPVRRSKRALAQGL